MQIVYNGACEKEPESAKDSIKYCYADEIADYYASGQNVVYYCSKGRRTYEQWEHTKELMKRRIPDAKLTIITFHRGTQRSYIFVLHKEDFRKYIELIKKFLYQWPKVFTEEFGRVGNLVGGKTGEKFHVVNSTGVGLTIEECEDGWVNIHYTEEDINRINKEFQDSESALSEYKGNYSKVINDYVRKGLEDIQNTYNFTGLQSFLSSQIIDDNIEVYRFVSIAELFALWKNTIGR